VNYHNEVGGYIEWNVNAPSQAHMPLYSGMQTEQLPTDLCG